MLIAFQKLFRFVFMAQGVKDIFGPDDDDTTDLVESSKLVWDMRHMWDSDHAS